MKVMVQLVWLFTVEVMTDNRNRAAADVRHAFSKQGGNLGESGCVGWMFKSKGVFVIDKKVTMKMN